MKYFIKVALLAVLCAGGLQSCRREYNDVYDYKERKVLIFCAAGFNNLSLYMQADLNEMVPTLPTSNLFSRYKVIVISHTPTPNGNYYDTSGPVIYDFYRDEYGNAARDTVYRFEDGSSLTDATVFSSAMNYIKDNYPAKEYGLCISSHGSGWLPDDYYTFPTYDAADSYIWSSPARRKANSSPEDPVVAEYFSARPTVKSIMAKFSSGTSHYKAMNVPELASAIPFKLDYILMDMCLMGCVEVAYELRNVTDRIVFSSMEVMADGFQYKSILNRLFYAGTADLRSVCEDTYNFYVASQEPYSTISLVNCSKIQPLARICAEIVENNRGALDSLNASSVQRFYRHGRHFFYDLQDVFVKAGISQEEQSELQTALDDCVEYKAATQWGVYKDFEIKTFCGMSMFLPCNGSSYIQNYYKGYDWNDDTSLVK